MARTVRDAKLDNRDGRLKLKRGRTLLEGHS